MGAILIPFICHVVAAGAHWKIGQRMGHGALWLAGCIIAGLPPLILSIDMALLANGHTEFASTAFVLFFAFFFSPILTASMMLYLAVSDWPPRRGRS